MTECSLIIKITTSNGLNAHFRPIRIFFCIEKARLFID